MRYQVDPPKLETLIFLWKRGVNVATLARRYWVSETTAKRWFQQVEEELARQEGQDANPNQG